MDGPNRRTASITDLPLEVLCNIVGMAHHADQGATTLSMALTCSALYGACTATIVPWKQRHEHLAAVLPVGVAEQRYLSVLDVAWYAAAVRALRRKRILYAIKVLCLEHDSDSVDTDSTHESTPQFDQETLSGLEVWAQCRSSSLALAVSVVALDPTQPPFILGPLGPSVAAVTPDTPGLFALSVMCLDDDDIDCVMQHHPIYDVVANNHSTRFSHTVEYDLPDVIAKMRANEILTLCLKAHAGHTKPQCLVSAGSLSYATVSQGSRHLCVPRCAVCASCHDPDLWSAYPNACTYLIQTTRDEVWFMAVRLTP